MAQAVLASPYGDYEDQLASMGLRSEYLYHAIEADEQERRLVTANDPPEAGGMRGYYIRVRTIREDLILREGWKRASLNGLPLVVNPDRTIAIGVLLGDHKTGWPGNYHPRSARPVGNSKAKLIAQNPTTLTLFPVPVPPDTADLESADLAKLTTWYLITYRRVFRDKVVVASELSLPCNVDEAGRVDKYTRRIPLPEREFAAVIPYIPGQDDGPGEYDVNVDEI